MADKNEELQSPEDKASLAKELYGTGCRSLVLKLYSDAIEDLSKSCELFATVYGDCADELGLPYLMYAKALIGSAQQGENKVVDVPDEDDEENDGKEEEEEEEEADNQDEDNDAEVDEQTKENGEDKDTNGTNGILAQPGTSSSTIDVKNKDNDDNDDNDSESDTPAANLQLAWEVLELAVQIFTRQGEPGLSNLSDAYFELAEISFENSHFDIAIEDYKNSEKIRMKLSEDNLRLLSLIQYKIGLCYYTNNAFDEAIKAFKKSCDIFECHIDTLNSKEDKSEKDVVAIGEVEEMKQEILAKIAEIEEVKLQSSEDIKKMLAKFINGEPDAQGPSQSSSAAGSSKPTDISHLIKRKKPDTPNFDDDIATAAKKRNIDN